MSSTGTTLADFGGGDEVEEARHVAEGDEVGELVDLSEYQFPDADGVVEVSVTQVDYTVEGFGDDEYPVLHVFGRTADETTEHIRVFDFQPYFYTPISALDHEPPDSDRDLRESDFEDDRLMEERIIGLETKGQHDPSLDDSVADEVAVYESIRGDRLVKVLGQTPRDVGQLRDRFDHYEADILFPNRLLIDKDITAGVRVPDQRAEDGSIKIHHEQIEPTDLSVDPCVHTFDIEVDDRSGFPEDGEEQIICMTGHDSYRDEYVVWLYDAPDATVPAPEALEFDFFDDESDIDLRVFDTEEAMHEDYLTYLNETDPDILTGWNFDDFDAPYYVARLEELGLDSNRLSRVNEVWDSGWGGPNIKGRVVFDLLYAYERRQYSELDSYRLDAVAEEELGVGKERYTGDIGDLWEQDPKQLLEYNLRDVELCVEIDEKVDLISFWSEVATFVGCKLEDATTPGDAVDLYILHKVHGDFALPSKGTVESEDYEGGAVFDPISGIRENVTVLDLKSLYPMCMVTTNASPETKVDPSEYDGETYRAPNGTHFRKEPDGIIREMVDELLTERENKKAARDEYDPNDAEYTRYDSQQAAVKVIMNSLYGVLGWDRFRLYDKEMGAAVTATGREVLEHTEQSASELGYDIAYGDSITGNRPVVVRDPRGNLRIIPIETLFKCSEPSAEADILITADGGVERTVGVEKERGELDGWEALSVNTDGESEWKPIEEIIRHQTDKDVVTLQHKLGESTTTRDHSYVVEDGETLVETKPEDVSEPLRVPDIPDVKSVERIDVFDVLDGYNRIYKDGRMVGSEHATEKTKRVCANEERVWFGHEHHGELDSTVTVQRYIDIDSDDGAALLRLLAAYVTEGSASTIETTESRFGASIAESRRDWLEGLQTDYHRLFEHTTASIITSDTRTERTVKYETIDETRETNYDDTTQKLQMMNELAAVFFRAFAGQTSRKKRLPSFVYHLPREHQSLFLDVLIEGDGSRAFPRYSEGYAERNFDFETTSRELAAGLSTLLTQRDKKHSLKYRESKQSYTIRTCDYYRSGRDPVVTESEHDGYVYDLSVADNENFVDGVGGIVLHNTDSVMLELGEEYSKQDAIDTSFEIEEYINKSYDEFALEQLNAEFHRFQIEFEKLYRRFFQAGKKKRYAGHIIWKEGKDVDDIDITGFEYKRSDIAPVTKEVQKNVLDMIVTEGDVEGVKEYVHDTIEEFQKGERPLDDIGIPGGIGKRLDSYDTDTAHVRGAKYANLLLGTNFQRGSKPKRLYLKKIHPDFWTYAEEELGLDPQRDPLYGEFKRDPDVICFEYMDEIPDEFEVHWDKMLEKTLRGPIERILESLDVSWEEVRDGQEQTGLSSFM